MIETGDEVRSAIETRYSDVAGPSSEAVEIVVLGPVEAVRDAERLEIGGPRQRRLLALLGHFVRL